jgi:hypothetical protein
MITSVAITGANNKLVIDSDNLRIRCIQDL